MKRLLTILMLAVLGVAPVAVVLAAGSVTVTRAGNPGAQRLDITWLSEPGLPSTNTLNVSQTIGGINGFPERVVYVIDTATTPTRPLAGYDVRLLDVSGVDVLSSTGCNLAITSDATPRMFFPSTTTLQTTGTQIYDVGPLVLQVRNAGTTPTVSTGEIRLYVRD